MTDPQNPVGPQEQPGGPAASDATATRSSQAGALPPPRPPAAPAPVTPALLLLTVLVIATAGLVYELLAGAIATSVLGNSLRQYSLTIGVYLFSMGVGSYASKFIDRRLAERFVDVEYAAALIGGTQGLLLFLAYGHAVAFSLLLYVTLFAIGMLVGIEIPLLMRILRSELDFKDLVAKVLTFDYLGALLGSLVFSIVLVEFLMVPLEQIGLLFGLLNCAVGILSTWILRRRIYPALRLRLRIKGTVVAATLLCAMFYSGRLRALGEQELYGDRIIFAQQSAYQRLVVTAGDGRVQLFLDGNLQFSSLDEYRYHEALVHPAMAAARRRSRILVLGGGDGLAVRELLRYPEVETITLVDLDPAVTRLARTLPALRKLNAGALEDPRVELVHDDAMVWLDQARRGPFDVAIVDFPDPNNFALGKLYTRRFYQLLSSALSQEGLAAVQSTSPLLSRESFWCVEASMRAAGLHTAPYHVPIPSFGEWGYVLVGRAPLAPPRSLRQKGLRYLNDGVLPGMFVFPQDMARVDAEVNRLNHQVLVRYYSRELSRIF